MKLPELKRSATEGVEDQSSPTENLGLLETFATCRQLRLHRDPEDYTRVVRGARGQVYCYDEHRLGVLLDFKTARQRKFASRRLSGAGCTVIQEGDFEVAAAFDPMDNRQAKVAIAL